MVRYNPINDRIIDEILKGKYEINFDKKIVKEEDELSGSFNKLVGNLTAMTLRKYILNIINYHGLNLKVSNSNAFIKGCPIEWDLIILKSNAEDINNTNVFAIEDVVAVLEFKTSGLRTKQLQEIDKTFGKQFEFIKYFKNTQNKNIIFGYITFAETIEFYNATKNYFNRMNNIEHTPTAFAFLEYDSLDKFDKKCYIEECNDFEEFLYGILK